MSYPSDRQMVSSISSAIIAKINDPVKKQIIFDDINKQMGDGSKRQILIQAYDFWCKSKTKVAIDGKVEEKKA